MQKTKSISKKICLTAMLVCLFFTCIVSAFFVNRTSAATFTVDLVETNGITLTTGEVDAESDSGSVGVLFSGSRKGASATFNRTFAGELDMRFDLPSENGTTALTNVAFVFESDKGQSFSLHYVTDTNFTGFYVQTNGERAGVSGSETSRNNANGIYTSVTGKDVWFEFDPVEMTVYAGSASTGETLVWDFSEEYNFKKTLGVVLDPFACYDLSIVFEEIASDKEGKFLLYEINGTALDGTVIRNAQLPRIGASALWQPIVNETYKVPQPYAVNVLNDEIESTDIKVKATQGNTEVLAECAWTEDLAVTFTQAGACTFTYSVTVDGETAEQELTVNAIARKNVDNEWTYSRDLNKYYSSQLGKGATITLPAASYTSTAYQGVDALAATVSVLLDGEEIATAKNLSASEEQTFTFSETGVYTVRFDGADAAAKAKDSFEFYVSDALPVLSYTGLKASYPYNATVALPTDAEISFGAEKATATRRIVYPSGKSFYNTNVTLDEAGTYTIVYSAMIGEVGYSLKETFVVYANNTDLFYNVSDRGGMTLESSGSYLDESERGVFVSAKAGTEIKYANVIDLSDMKQEDVIIDLRVIPDVVGELNFGVLWVRLTDIYDENNYIDIKCKDAGIINAGGCMYIQAGATGQTLSGAGSNAANSYAGFTTTTSFRSMFIGSSLGLSMDYAERKVFCTTSWTDYHFNSNDFTIADLDSTDEFVNPWNGFTTGEVYLTLRPEGLVSTANMVIKSVAGLDLAQDSITDNDAPQISVEYDSVETLPSGIVGVKYPLPTLKVRDLHATRVSTRVYSVFQGMLNEVAVDDNCFTPDKVGKYAIVYTAEDVYGNVTEKTEYIDVQAAADARTLTLDIVDGATTGFVGMPLTVAGVQAEGGIGYMKMKVLAENATSGDNFELEEPTFIPYATGTWKITYRLYDYFGDERAVEKSYEITVSANTQPAWDENIVISPMFIDGYTYELPMPVAYDYYANVSEPVAIKPTVQVTDGAGTRTIENGAYVADIATHGDTVTLVYTWTPANGDALVKTFYSQGAIVGENGSLDISKYFVTNDMSITLDKLSADFTVTGENPTATFGRALLADGCSFVFNVGKAVNNFESISIYLVDSLDMNATIKLTIYKRPDGVGASYMSINDGEVRSVQGSFWEENLISLGFSYSALTKEIFDGTGSTVGIVETTAYGKEFNGFTSGRVYLTFQIEGVTGDSAVTVKTINEQYICSQTEDMLRPGVVFLGSIGGTFTPNTEVEIPALLVDDVLSEIASATVTVIAPNGNAFVAMDGTSLLKASAYQSYMVKLTQMGTYTVQYLVTDTTGFRQLVERTILVPDVSAPTVDVHGKIPTSAKVGDKISVPTFSATDDFSESSVGYVIITEPTCLAYVTTAEEITLTSAGIWRIRYFVYDDYYNCTIVDYTIEVK